MSSAKSDRAGHLCSNCAAHEALQTRDLPKRRSRCARRFGGPGSAAHRIAPSRHRSWQRGFMRSRCAASGTQPLMQCRKPANLTRPTSPAGASHHDFFSPDIRGFSATNHHAASVQAPVGVRDMLLFDLAEGRIGAQEQDPAARPAGHAVPRGSESLPVFSWMATCRHRQLDERGTQGDQVVRVFSAARGNEERKYTVHRSERVTMRAG
jgi:hypothetical protein